MLEFLRGKNEIYMTQSEPTKPRFQFSRISEVLLQPQHTFAMLVAENTGWQLPMLALSISSTLVIIISGFLKARAASMGEVTLPPDWQWWTPDMQNNYMQAQQSMQGPVFLTMSFHLWGLCWGFGLVGSFWALYCISARPCSAGVDPCKAH